MIKMYQLLNLSIIFIFVCSFQISSGDGPKNRELMKSPLNKTINDFGLKILQQLTKNDENQCNIFVSPFSIMLMFTMLLHGTGDQTNQQILDAFGYLNDPNLSKEAIHQSFQDLLYEISKKQRNYTLNIGSIGLFKDGLNPNRKFRTKLFEDYNAVIMNLNFRNQKLIEKTLTNWIRTITSNRVTKLDNTGNLNEKTNFALLNAIYFQGKWKYPFSTLSRQHTFYNQMNSNVTPSNNDPALSKTARKAMNNFEDKLVELTDQEEKRYFNLTKDKNNHDLFNENVLFKPSKVEMMGILRPFNYVKADNGEFELFELPYEGDLSMFIILPNYQIKMQYVLANLNSSYLNSLIDRMDKEKLRLMVPKLRIEQKLELKSSMRNFGLVDLFNEDANFTPMFSNQAISLEPESPSNQTSAESQMLYINQAIHNAFINVDEKGTSVYGSTSLKSFLVSGLREIVLQINRPFIFFIKDTTRDTILFSGTLCRFI